ncbi:MAG: 6-bladed beta-propeller [Gallionellales bacterium GWA2_60_18]|nr:MAG: 6-bladed beta-propeller [Gallionellales bacterium GWA2_60_18]
MNRKKGNNMSNRILVLLLAVASTILTACAPVQQGVKETKTASELVYPAPPDDPRFIYERTIRGSADVVPVDDEFGLRSALTGERQTTRVLGKPYAVAVHQGRIFISDTAERVVKVFDVPGSRYFTIGEDEGSLLSKPIGIDVDHTGTLYVADASAKAIMIYDRDGKFLRKIASPKSEKLFDRLTSVSVDPEGKRLYVVDIGGVSSTNHRVMVFDALSGEHLSDIGKRGNGPGEFNLPRDVAVGKDGRLYVVDGGNFRVQIFDAGGKYLQSFGSVGKQLGNFARPKEIATDPEGNVYVIDSAFGNFQIFTPDGELLMFVGDRSEREAPGRYMLPSGVAVDEDGRVYVIDQWFRKLDVFRPYNMQAEEGFLVTRPKAATGK